MARDAQEGSSSTAATIREIWSTGGGRLLNGFIETSILISMYYADRELIQVSYSVIIEIKQYKEYIGQDASFNVTSFSPDANVALVTATWRNKRNNSSEGNANTYLPNSRDMKAQLLYLL